jgi:hypothetical protein
MQNIKKLISPLILLGLLLTSTILTKTSVLAAEQDETSDTNTDADLSFLQDTEFQNMYHELFGADITPTADNIVYVAGEAAVSATNENHITKGKYGNPYIKLSDAYATINGTENTIIYLQSEYSIDSVSGDKIWKGYTEDEELESSGWPVYDTPVIIVSDKDVYIPMYDTLYFYGDIGFYRTGIQVKYQDKINKQIYCNGHKIILGGQGKNNFTVKSDTGYYPTIFGGSKNTEINDTNLTINGGTFSRIFGAGFTGSTVTGTAKTIIDGRVNDDDGEAITGLSSVTIVDKDNLARTAYSFNETKYYEDISGGAAGNSRVDGSKGTVGETDLTIRYLNYGSTCKYYVAPNGGDITGDTNITVEQSNILRLQRGPGEVYGNWNYIVKDNSTANVDIHHLYDYNTGISPDITISVLCTDSTIPEFYGKYDSGSVNNGGRGKETRESKYPIYLSYTFTNCTLGTNGNYFKFDQANYKKDDLDVDITIDGCTFVNGAKVGGIIRSANTHYTFKNLKQTILFGTKENTTETTNEEQVVLYSDNRKASVTLESAKMTISADQQIPIQSLTLNTDGVCNTDTITIPYFSGNGGTINVSDQSTVTLSTVEPDSKCKYGAYGTITDRCTIVGGVNAISDDTNQFENGQSTYYYYKYGGKATSVWILSFTELDFDPNKCIYVDQKGGTDPSNLDDIENPANYGTMSEPVKTLKAAYLLVTENRNKIVFVSAYTASKEETLKQNTSQNIHVIWCANDGLTDYQDTGIVTIKDTYYLPSDTTFDKLKILGKSTEDNFIYANGYTIIVNSNVTATNVSLFGDSGKDSVVNQVNLIINGGNWTNVGVNGSTVGNSDGLNSDNTKNADIVNISFGEIAKAVYNVYVNGTVYGNTNISFSDKSTLNKYNGAGTYYGDVNITLWEDGSANFNTFDGTYYGQVNLFTTMKGSAIRPFRISGQYYKNSSFTFDSTCAIVSDKDVPAIDVEISEVQQNAEVSIYAQEGSSADKMYLYTEHQALAGGGKVHVYMNGTVPDIYSNNKNKAASGYDITLTGNKTNEYTFTLKNLYGWDYVTVAENTNVTVDATDVTLIGLQLNENAKVLSPSKTTLGWEEQENGELVLESSSELRCLETLALYGNAKGNNGQLTLNHTPDTPSIITQDVSGTIYMDSAYQYTIDSVGVLKGEFLKTGVNTTLDNLLVKKSDDEGFKYAISEYSANATEKTWRFGRILDHSVIYLKDTGDDNKNGLTTDTAVQTLYRAFELVEPGGTIVICGDTHIEEWPSNDYKDITYTSYDKYHSNIVAVDYSSQQDVTFTIPTNVFLHSNTVFESVNVLGLKNLCANGYAVTFGIESTQKDEEQTNFRSENILRVVGSYYEDVRYPVNITIHSGEFSTVDPWCSNQDIYGNADEVVITVTMTGGYVEQLGVGTEEPFQSQRRDNPIGKAIYNLSGGHVGRLGYNKSSDYGENSQGKYTETYNVSDSFRFDSFYAGCFTDYNGTVTLNITDTGTSEDEAFDMICYGNSLDKARNYPLIVNLTNARIKLVKGGNSTQKYTGDNVVFNLYKDAIIDEFYCGSSTTMGNNIKRIEVNLLNETANIGKLYSHGYGTELRASEIQVAIAEGSETKFDDFDFIDTSVDMLQVGADITETDSNINTNYVGFVSLARNTTGKFTSLKILADSKAYIARGVSFTGDYIGVNDGDTLPMILLPDAGNLSFNGSVTGQTKVLGLSEDESFENGFVISANTGTTDSFIYMPSSNDDRELIYSSSDNSIWKLEPLVQIAGNIVYVSGSMGVDAAGTQGTEADPVQTLAYGYKLAKTRYENLLEQLEDNTLDTDEQSEIQKELDEGIFIDVMNSIELGDFSNIPGYSTGKVTVQGMAKDGSTQIIFNDKNYTYRTTLATTIRNITLTDVTTQDAYVPSIYAEGNKLLIENTVNCENSSQKYAFTIYGGAEFNSVANTDIEIKGGIWNQIFGGSSTQTVTDSTKVTLDENVKVQSTNTDQESYGSVFGGGNLASATVNNTLITINNGNIYQVYGGGNVAAVDGTASIQFNQGQIYSLYGGGLETQASTKNTLITIGTDNNSTAEIMKSVRGGGQRGYVEEVNLKLQQGSLIDENVSFCAGGYAGEVGTVNLFIQDGSIIKSDIYGGGYGIVADESCGNVNKAVNVTVNGGVLANTLYGGGNNGLVKGVVTVTINGGIINGNVYGGGNAAGVESSEVNLIAGNIKGNVFGGSYNIEKDARQIQKEAKLGIKNTLIEGSVFGGSDTSGTINKAVSVNISGNNAIVQGSIYGGGNKAAVSVAPEIYVQTDANLSGDIYGGGKGETSTSTIAKIRRAISSVVNTLSDTSSLSTSGLTDANVPATFITISGTVNGNIYGGGELATVGDAESDNWEDVVTTILMQDDAEVYGNIYGGGKGKANTNYAVIYGSTLLQIDGGTIQAENDEGKITDSEEEINGSVFGGGQISPVTGNTNIIAAGGTISNIFGGNDLSGIVYQGANVTIPDKSTTNIAHLYGGGRKADIEKSTIHISDGYTQVVYGGGNEATVTSSVNITVDTDKEQHIDTLFVGNNSASTTIKPNLYLESGKIGAVFCGGNAGIMNIDNLSYEFDYPNIEVEELYAGCNNTQEMTSDVLLTLVSGTYHTVYGGNDTNGYMNSTNIQISESKKSSLNLDTVYGGGNNAESLNTNVSLNSYSEKENHLSIYAGGNNANVKEANLLLDNGYVYEVYGGGNAATVTKSTTIISNDTSSAHIENLYCGNNKATMNIHPSLNISAIEINNFYGGGNAGAMKQNLEYTFDNSLTCINTIYGGCNNADVEGNVTLNLAGATLHTIYGGCNTSGHVYTTNIYVDYDADSVFGGGCGENTNVDETNVLIRKGTISKNIYGGSGYGSVTNANIEISDKKSDGIIDIQGNVFGAGYGETSVTQNTNVNINTNITIATSENAKEYDLLVTETSDDYEIDGEVSSGETNTKIQWIAENKAKLSKIEGSVYGGADMGRVGSGFINTGNNTAEINTVGNTNVCLTNGYIQGNLFGGGNGTASDGSSYTVYMGAVFGSSNTTVTGGFVEGSIFGCGNQARTYASSKNKAALLNITETVNTPILIGTSVFAGGMRGDNASFNATVYTVVGDVEVNILGIDASSGLVSKPYTTKIFFLSENYGSIYGDGNLCLVNGERVVNITNFNFGEEYGKLKMFYSLQRADVVNLHNTRIVLEGAEDLVDADDSGTLYSINRVSQLNMYNNSAIKLTTVVNYLGGLWSDQDTDTLYIDNGNNGINGYTKRNGSLTNSVISSAMEDEYRTAYEELVTSNKVSSKYKSMNVVAVANGEYLDIKQLDNSYGNVTGLFTLQLLHANEGEGGGFVYADIGYDNHGTTGDFICVTKLSTDNTKYMDVIDSVGGYKETDYTYYYWYLKGDSYNYKVNLNGYIGTTETDFPETVLMPTNITTNGKDYYYVLNSIGGDNLVDDLASQTAFNKTRFVDDWKEEYSDQDKYAIEVVAHIMPASTETKREQEESIGYLSYDDATNTWSIKKDNTTRYTGLTNFDAPMSDTSQKEMQENIVLTAAENTEYIRFELILHKGSGVDLELKNVMNNFSFSLKMLSSEGKYIDVNDSSTINVTTQTTITRIVPTQDVYVSSGRQYTGVGSDSPAKITGKSAFTVQYITKYIPSIFNANGGINEYLDFTCTQKYLLSEDGVGFTVQENNNDYHLVAVTTGIVADYKDKLSRNSSGEYIYKSEIVADDGTITEKEEMLTCKNTVQSSSILPAGTTITLLANINDGSPTYWYYYCKEDTTKINLSEFVCMNKNQDSNEHYTLALASNGTVSGSTSTRITENLIFVVDFVSTDMQDTLKGNLQLKHEYTSSAGEKKDIMDYLQKKTSDNNTVAYVRSYPLISNYFEINPNVDTIKEFSLDLQEDKAYENDILSVNISVTQNNEYINTRYDERQYSTRLTLFEQNNKGEWQQIAFPQGTVFTSGNSILKATEENKSVTVPTSISASTTVTIDTNLGGFEAGKKYKLCATLYSATDANYYNDLATLHEDSAEFSVVANTEHSLKVSANTLLASWRVIKQKGVFSGGIQIKDDDTDGDYDKIKVNLYKQNGESYSSVALTSIFDNTGITNSKFTWLVNENAQAGVYRLEFKYYDKVEYLDIIIK